MSFAYAPITPPGRVPPVWAQPLVLLGLAIAAALLMVGFTLAISAWASLTGRPVDPAAPQAWYVQLLVSVLFLGGLAAFTLLWILRFEHRRLSTAGLARPRPADAAPWLAGAAFAAIVGLWLAGGAPSTPIAGPGGVGAILAAVGMLALTAVVMLSFGAVEELVFRGWSLSALAPRIGVGWALGVTSIVFGAVHVFPWEWGDPARLAGFVGFAAMGVAFGAVALARRSLWSAIALHGGYNFAFAGLAAADAGFDPSRMVQGAMGGGSGFSQLETALTLAVSQVVMAAAAVTWWRWGLRRPSSPVPAS